MINKIFADRVISQTKANGMPLQLSKLIAAQSGYETANWTSNAFVKGNNGFGYKFVKNTALQLRIPVVKSTEKDYYAAYATFEMSITEICSWIVRRQKETKFPQDLVSIQTPEQYAHLLKNCDYYGGKENDYATGLHKYLAQLL